MIRMELHDSSPLEQKVKVIKSPSGFDFTFKTGKSQLSKRRKKQQSTETNVEEQNRKLCMCILLFTRHFFLITS